MERICEFCAGLRPIIYCKPDAARLCLSCDAKVHSANALSSRHLRTLLCDLCGNFPTYLRCLDHQMFLCRNCDRRLHDASSRHQKRTIRGYMGCPSARDLAVLWGFEMNELDDISQDQFASTCGSETSSVTHLDISGQTFSHMVGMARVSYSPHVSVSDHKFGSLTRRSKMLYKRQEQSSSFILQQILDLNRLQRTKGNSNSPLIRCEDKDVISSSTSHTLEKFDETLKQHLRHSRDLGTDLQQRDDLLPELKMNPLSISFSQLENSPLSSAIVLPSHGESLWQFKTPAENSQLWSQNMEDLGVCDELIYHDDFNIPEVDSTFQSIEDIFDGDEDPIRGLFDSKDESMSYSSMDKDMSLDKSDNHLGKGMEASSVTSSACILRSARMDKDMDHSDQFCYPPTSTECPRPIRPSSSTLSFSDSRLSIDSAGSDCLDKAELSCSSHCPQEHKHSIANIDGPIGRKKEKKQSQLHDGQIRPSYRKARSLVRKRIKGRYAKPEQYDSDIIAMSRSY